MLLAFILTNLAGALFFALGVIMGLEEGYSALQNGQYVELILINLPIVAVFGFLCLACLSELKDALDGEDF